MKTQLLKILLPLALLGLASGCAMKPMVINPAAPPLSRTDKNTIIDDRIVTHDKKQHGFGLVVFAANTKPHPPKELNIGYSGNLTFQLQGPEGIAKMVAGIAANKYPDATVRLIDARCKVTVGFWMTDFDAFLVADLEQGGGKVRIAATGRNVMSLGTKRNFEIAYERALHDFAAKINAAPADLSRVVTP